MTKLQYIKNNIKLIQTKKKWESETKVLRENGEIPFRNHTEVTKYLFDRLYKLKAKKKDRIFKEWQKLEFKKNKFEIIAIKHLVYKSHLEKILNEILKKNLLQTYNNEKIKNLSKNIINNIQKSLKDEDGFKAIKTELTKVFPNAIYFALNGGFSKNLTHIKPGEDSTFFGQAAQFLFLARALRAGYNASNVDLPSSKYDAILDTGRNKTVKIQIKGYEGNSISFFTRARGGQGIDSSDITNQQVRITAEWCDFYVAVDHRVGTCFILPMVDVDQNFTDTEARSVKLDSILEYKEAWHLFDSITDEN
jgi:hypothetical protein